MFDVGDPPMIDRTVAAPGAVVIGTTICIDPYIAGELFELTITCSQNSTNIPEVEPKATFLINGESTLHYSAVNHVVDLPGIYETLTFFMEIYILEKSPGPYEGTITCFLNNIFGSDMETSLMLRSMLIIACVTLPIQQILLSHHLLVPFKALYQMVVMELDQVMSYVPVKVNQLI